MKFLIKETTDNSFWNQFVLTHHPWSFFQSWEWGEVQKKLDQKVWRWAIYDDKKLIGQTQGALVQAKRGAFLHLRHGPVIAKEYLYSIDVWHALIDYLRPIASNHHAWFIRLNPMIENTFEVQKLFSSLRLRSAPIHAMDAETCWVLPLNKTETELLSQMRKTNRYLIRQAEKNGVKIEVSDDIHTFLALYGQTAQRQRFVTHKGIREEFEILKQKNMLELFVTRYQQQPVSAAMILYWGQEAIYHHSASIPTKIGANHLLQWEVIKRAKNRKLRYYNFWGVAPPDQPRHPWQNITLFKMGFGGQSMRFTHACDLPVSSWYPITYLIETIRKIKRGY